MHGDKLWVVFKLFSFLTSVFPAVAAALLWGAANTLEKELLVLPLKAALQQASSE